MPSFAKGTSPSTPMGGYRIKPPTLDRGLMGRTKEARRYWKYNKDLDPEDRIVPPNPLPTAQTSSTSSTSTTNTTNTPTNTPTPTAPPRKQNPVTPTTTTPQGQPPQQPQPKGGRRKTPVQPPTAPQAPTPATPATPQAGVNPLTGAVHPGPASNQATVGYGGAVQPPHTPVPLDLLPRPVATNEPAKPAEPATPPPIGPGLPGPTTRTPGKQVKPSQGVVKNVLQDAAIGALQGAAVGALVPVAGETGASEVGGAVVGGAKGVAKGIARSAAEGAAKKVAANAVQGGYTPPENVGTQQPTRRRTVQAVGQEPSSAPTRIIAGAIRGMEAYQQQQQQQVQGRPTREERVDTGDRLAQHAAPHEQKFRVTGGPTA